MADAPLACDVFDARPTLVLLHAFPLDRRMWGVQVAALADVAQVVTVDLPGFGESAGVAVAPDLDLWADRVEALLAEVVGAAPVVVAGLSMGGYVALRLAARHPARLDALVLADTRAAADSAEGRAARDATIRQVRTTGIAPLADALLPRLLSPHADPETVAMARELVLAQGVDGVVAALEAMRDRPDSTAVLSQVHVPTLVIVGGEDALTPPAEAEAMARALPASWLVQIPHAGHLANLEAPEAFSGALVGFLSAL